MEAIIVAVVTLVVLQLVILLHYRGESKRQRGLFLTEKKYADEIIREKNEITFIVRNELGYHIDRADKFKLVKIKKK